MTQLMYRFEATAQLAAYGHRVEASLISPRLSQAAYDLAGQVALRDGMDPAAALEQAASLGRDEGLPFEVWRRDAANQQAVERRVALQDNFAFNFDEWLDRVTSSNPIAKLRARRARLGAGQTMTGYAVDCPTDGRSVLKVPTAPGDPGYRAATVERLMARLLPLEGLPRTEQLHGISYLGALGTSLLPGKPYATLKPDALQGITDQHLLDAAETITEGAARRVIFDHVGEGQDVFDPEVGFGLFDPSHVVPAGGPISVVRQLDYFRGALAPIRGEHVARPGSDLARARAEVAQRFASLAGIARP